jgi:hypothetical protein
MADSTAFFFRRPRPIDPGQADNLGRALRDLWQRVKPRGPNPGPLPDPTPQPKPEPDKKPDRRTDECVGECEEEKKRCPEKTFCFNKSKFVGTPKEAVYDSQLRVQEATMRTMSPAEVLGNRATYETVGRSALESLPAVSARRSYIIGLWQDANPGQDWRAQGLEALHRLDMGAGGAPTGYYAMGDKNVNRSIGGGWPSKTDSLKQHARNLQATNCPLMKVRFDSSASCVADSIPESGYPE